MKKVYKIATLFLGFSFLFLLFSPPYFANANVFYRNLKLGDTGSDVYSLQVILNENTATELAQTGPGSKGNETNYFGLVTQNAVVRFQNLYPNDILVPAGISSGTGYVGEKTRAKLESLFSNAQTNQTTTTSSVTTNPVFTPSTQINLVSANPNRSNVQNQISSQASQGIFSGFTLVGPAILPKPNLTPRLYFVDPYEVTPGGVIILHGVSFALDFTNTVSIGSSYSVPNLKSANGNTLVVTLPNALQSGEYEVWVNNPNGLSQNVQNPISFVITSNPVPPPHIISVSPFSPTINSNITITGENFSATGNNIYSYAGLVPNLSSPDGKTISVSLSSFPLMSKITAKVMTTTFPFWLTVQNTNGVDRGGYKIQITNTQL
jgi:peptidoglycan hydrolase-like protein with peptidoglycan-binding domain